MIVNDQQSAATQQHADDEACDLDRIGHASGLALQARYGIGIGGDILRGADEVERNQASQRQAKVRADRQRHQCQASQRRSRLADEDHPRITPTEAGIVNPARPQELERPGQNGQADQTHMRHAVAASADERPQCIKSQPRWQALGDVHQRQRPVLAGAHGCQRRWPAFFLRSHRPSEPPRYAAHRQSPKCRPGHRQSPG